MFLSKITSHARKIILVYVCIYSIPILIVFLSNNTCTCTISLILHVIDLSTMHTVPYITVTEGVQDMAVIIGEQVNFSCSVLTSEVDKILWTVDGTVYETCPAEGNTNICFENRNMSDTTRSTLIVTNSSRLGIESHTVQCIMQRAGFETIFNETSTASLRIHPGESLLPPSPLTNFTVYNFWLHELFFVHAI